MLGTNEETVRRWIRSGKLESECCSKRQGNIITSESLSNFMKQTPKYAALASTPLFSSPIAMSIAMGTLFSTMMAASTPQTTSIDQNNIITSYDIDYFLQNKIKKQKETIKEYQDKLAFYNEEIKKLQEALQFEIDTLYKYNYFYNNLDFADIATQLNQELGKD